MDTKQQITDLLEQIKHTTGIQFSIEDNTGDDETTLEVLKNMLHAQHSGTSKEGFLRSLLLGVLSQEDILQGAHRYHIDRQSLLFPVLLEGRQSFSSMELSIFGQYFSSGADTLVSIDDSHMVVLHQVSHSLDALEMRQFVEELQNFLEAEAMISMTIAYDQLCDSLEALPKIFLSISTAAEIGSIFYPTQHIFWAHDLGMGKLIYHLPENVCQDYINDHFKGLQVDKMDEETLHTIHVFLESGLNIAECARKLFLHRNTLIYRLDKIEKLTGLDIRRFDDAMTCKVAMMMSTYLLQNN